MARRRVQSGIVNASDADVGAGAPGFRATWQSKDDLRQQVMNISDVPKNGKLYFWDGQLWLRWDDPDDLPGPEGDPLRIKIVSPENTCTWYTAVFMCLQCWFVISTCLLMHAKTCQEVQEFVSMQICVVLSGFNVLYCQLSHWLGIDKLLCMAHGDKVSMLQLPLAKPKRHCMPADPKLPDFQGNFQQLLKKSRYTRLNQEVLDVIVRWLAPRMMVCSRPEQAADLYHDATFLPGAST